MKQNAITQAIGKFFKTTNLHGFKYLVSQYVYDRVGWALCCLASGCCAGVLCVVLWDRFLQVPALLQLRELSDDANFQSIPTVAVCQPSDLVVQTFLKHIKTNGANTTRLPLTLENALKGKTTEEDQVDLLEELLKLNNVSLLQMLKRYSPECPQLTRNCRWRGMPVDCGRLFKKEQTRWGVCCVASPARFANISLPAVYRYDVIKKLDIGLQCLDGTGIQGCEFFTKYHGEESIVPTSLSAGYNYLAQLTFVTEQDSDTEKLVVDGTCISSKGYSRSQCLLKCTERKCRCTDPLRNVEDRNNEKINPCPLKRLSCLRTAGLKGNNTKNTCSCLPSCQKILTKLILEPGPYNLVQSSLDPIYSGLSITQGAVLQLRININSSKLFVLRPTETWLTLLSSLGGVFNMFLGVGLFSVLEFLFLFFVKLPIAIRRSTEMITPPTASTFH